MRLGLRVVVLALALGLPAASHGSGQPPEELHSYWVFFRDGGPEPAPALAEPSADLTPRALARRARAARERGEAATAIELPAARDLAPSETYVAALERMGARTRTRSRWLNAVSVEAKATALDAIRALPFVSEVLPVAVVTSDGASTSSADSTVTRAAAPRIISCDFLAADAQEQTMMVNVEIAHHSGYRGQGVLICVLDSGFDLSHESLRHLVVREQRDFLRKDRDVSFDPAQDLPRQAYHGTQVLSVLAGYVPERYFVGPAIDAEFLLGKTEDIGSEKQVEEDAWVEAVEWAEARGADILVSSLTYPAWYRPQDRDGRTAVITRAANLAFERGLLIVNSIGNYGPGERTLSPPADAEGVIAVGSVDSQGKISPFSSLGPTWDGRVKPDLVAQGSRVVVAEPGTGKSLTYGSGTSFSNPLVAGCAAIVLSAHPDWGPEAVREALTMTASQASQPDSRLGWGIPDARAAIEYPEIQGDVDLADDPFMKRTEAVVVQWESVGTVDSAAVAPSDTPPRGVTTAVYDGGFQIPNLPRGTYVLRIQAPGYLEAVSEPLQVPPSLFDLNFTLRRP
ncbi:MAG TPA: S8 family serine peptidase [Candidatus Eisenbacteria bacterium]|nr:S8 family serine peptidase [Candidatus Eisenbacteria bacterium]